MIVAVAVLVPRAFFAVSLAPKNNVPPTFADETAGSDVVLCRIEGGGRAWPGDASGATGAGLSGNDTTVSRDIDASELMWQFFAAHPRQ